MRVSPLGGLETCSRSSCCTMCPLHCWGCPVCSPARSSRQSHLLPSALPATAATGKRFSLRQSRARSGVLAFGDRQMDKPGSLAGPSKRSFPQNPSPECASHCRFMNHRVPSNCRYQPTEYEHAANCATHAVSPCPRPRVREDSAQLSVGPLRNLKGHQSLWLDSMNLKVFSNLSDSVPL